MSLSIIQQFSFNGKCVRSVYVSGEECLLSRDVYEAIGYDEQSGVQAIQRLVPRKYRLRFGDLLVINDQLHHNTVLLEKPVSIASFCGVKDQERSLSWDGFVKRFSQGKCASLL